MGDQQNAAAVPPSGQVGEEVFGGGQDLAVALAAGEGLVDVPSPQPGKNCLRVAVEVPVVAFPQAGIVVDGQCGAREGDPRGVHGAVQVGGEHRRDAVVAAAGVGVAPAQVAVHGLGLCGVAVVVGVGQGELPQWAEVGLDRVGPGGVGRGEAQFALVLLRPAADVRSGVGGEVVQDDVDRGAVGSGGADRLQRGQGVGGAFVFVRWKVMPWRNSRRRKASRPMRMTRPWTRRR